jgi:hypothetical protein
MKETFCQPVRFEMVQIQWTFTRQDQPSLRKAEIPKVLYAILLRALYNCCYDFHWDRLSDRILAYKFNLFPERRRWQIDKWVAQFRRQDLFPNASEAELREWAADLVMAYLI